MLPEFSLCVAKSFPGKAFVSQCVNLSGRIHGSLRKQVLRREFHRQQCQLIITGIIRIRRYQVTYIQQNVPNPRFIRRIQAYGVEQCHN